MLPLSVERTSSLGAGRREFHPSRAWLRPANVASTSSAEGRAIIFWVAVFVALGIGIALVHVWLRLQVVDLGYRLSTTRQVIEKLEIEGHELAVEVARLDAPTRLEQMARTRLGMVQPEKGQEVVLP